MNIELSTQLWMGSIITFGVVFYIISLYYTRQSNGEE